MQVACSTSCGVACPSTAAPWLLRHLPWGVTQASSLLNPHYFGVFEVAALVSFCRFCDRQGNNEKQHIPKSARVACIVRHACRGKHVAGADRMGRPREAYRVRVAIGAFPCLQLRSPSSLPEAPASWPCSLQSSPSWKAPGGGTSGSQPAGERHTGS